MKAMKGKNLFAVVLCAAMVFAMTACGGGGGGNSESSGDTSSTGAEDTGLTFAYFAGSMESTWLQNFDRAITALGDEKGFKIVNADAQWDADLQLSQIDTLIGQGIDGAAIFMVDASISEAVYDRFDSAGVPVVYETLPIVTGDGKLLAPGVILDTFEVGRTAARWYVENMEELGFDPSDWSDTGLLLGTNTIFTPTYERIEGFQEVFFEAYPDFPKSNIFVADVSADPNRPDDTEGAYNQATVILTANPQIEKWLCFASVDDYAIGTARAIETAGVAEESKLVSCGGERAMPEWENDPSVTDYWVGECYFNAMQYAEFVVEALLDMVQNGAPATDVLPDYKADDQDYAMVPISGAMVTPDNYKDMDFYLPGF
jgi:L-arabinose transport system substrate-binding protein